MDANQPLQWFSRVGQKKILSPFFERSEEKMSALKLFLQLYFATDLSPLHVKISRSTNLWSPCRRKLKLSTYLNTLSYNHISSPRSCQDIEEYEFVESLSEETQIIDLFKHFKLQPHKLSKYTLATCLSSCQFRILLSIR